MLKRNHALFAAGAMALAPLNSKAVTAALESNSNDMEASTAVVQPGSTEVANFSGDNAVVTTPDGLDEDTSLLGTSGVFNPSVTTTATTTAQPIISLMSAPPTTYGSQLGQTIALTYAGPGSYTPSSTTFSASNKGYGAITGFHSPDTEIYALAVLNSSGGVLTSAQISEVILDINASESGVTASLVTGVYSRLFPGYDILLTSTGTPPYPTDYLAIDFTSTGDQDVTTQGFTVGAIAAVPEPTTGLAIVGIASVRLLSRRKRVDVRSNSIR